MIIPWGTDAPIYHRPIATVTVMITNILIFIAFPSPEHQEWMLEMGGGTHPVQWLSNVFMHLGAGHLIGNMIFLWAFGIIVEGKLGAIGFLLVYLAMGIGESAMIQLFARPEQIGHALGASGAIFGLMTLCLIWAPRNDLYCIAFFRFIPFDMEIPILWFAGFYIALDVLQATASSLVVSSALIHAGGAAAGMLVGLLLLKTNLVDCEGWDLLTVMGGRHGRGGKPSKRKSQRSLVEKVQKRTETARKKKEKATDGPTLDPAQGALRMLREHLDADEIEAAMAFYKSSRRRNRAWRPPDSEWIELIKALLTHKSWEDAVGVMRAYLDESDLPSPKIQLRLAEVLIRRLDRPVAGLRVLESVSEAELTGPLQEVRRRLVELAEHMKEEGVLEIDDEVRGI